MNNYEKEKNDFETKFFKFRKKNIVLYGIGRFTATLLPMLENWKIVGLMDKNSERIGTYVYGLPILSLTEVEAKADLIIINTSGTYWNLIFQRIKHLNIPIYYRNGELAKEAIVESEIEYWNSSFLQLKEAVSSYEIISFDFFDTLFSRKTYMVSDIWEFMGDSFLNTQKKEEYLQLRKSVYSNIDTEAASLAEIYQKMNLDTLAEKEVELEKKFVVPRNILLFLLKDIIEMGKEVYIISDMYLPTDFFEDRLKENGINIPKEHIWISCDCGHTKRSGKLWIKFKTEVIKNRTALHIGDNMESDINNCKKYADISTYFVMAQGEMLHNSAIRNCLWYAENIYHNMLLGLCISKMFNNPFALCGTRGKVKIDNRKDFGYIVFGPIVFTFVEWLLGVIQTDSIHHLCFLGRDGFFLKQNFEYLYRLLKYDYEIDISYIETSRQILMSAGIESKDDFDEYMKMPYEGKLGEYLEERLQINLEESEIYNKNISMPQDYETVKKMLPKYKEEITKYIRLTKEQYLKYLESFNLENGDAVVDLGFYGTTQYYLSKLLSKRFVGYYIVANHSKSNSISKSHIIKSCTNVKADESCTSAFIHRMGLIIESFLTSPHGMVRSINGSGQFICAPNTCNQKFFKDKIEINEGIELFIKDMIDLHYERLDKLCIYIDDFVDNWYGLLIEKSVLSEEIRRSFYNDNAFVHHRCERIFDME